MVVFQELLIGVVAVVVMAEQGMAMAVQLLHQVLVVQELLS
jgi:hypothetical protein